MGRILESILAIAALLFGTRFAHADAALTMEQAVAIALQRNHDAIAAKLNIEGAQLDRVQAGLYPNPILSYTVGNLVVGAYNPQGDPPITPPGFFGQTQHALSLSEVIDVWAKRNARMHTADRSTEVARLHTADALREIVYAVRSAFVDVQREQAEHDLSHEMRVRYDETVRISRSRRAGGDISDAVLNKVELEAMRYQNAEIDAEMELDLSRQKLAALLGFGLSNQIPRTLETEKVVLIPLEPGQLLEQALRDRPDVRAAKESKLLSIAALAQARREALPELSLSLIYAHSDFLVSGDNPNSLGLGLSLPVPLFDRNQANIGRAKLDERRADNEGQRLVVSVQHDVADAVRHAARSAQLLSLYEGGMLERADSALRVAEKSNRLGAISLLELLEAQRTYLETRMQYVGAQNEYRQAIIDVMHAINGEIK